ncbi:hypothetical protein SOVF_022000 isoform A [Spinacia oleracea]|nr:hypothetical protein SOVF_022000 isoform A [Spinacia oleracea]
MPVYGDRRIKFEDYEKEPEYETMDTIASIDEWNQANTKMKISMVFPPHTICSSQSMLATSLFDLQRCTSRFLLKISIKAGTF